MIIVLLVFFLFLPLFCLLVIQLIPLGRCPLSCSSFSSFDYWNDSSCSFAIVPCLSCFWFLWLLIAPLLMAPICEGSVTFFFLLLFEWSFLFICYCSLSFLLLGSYGSSWLLICEGSVAFLFPCIIGLIILVHLLVFFLSFLFFWFLWLLIAPLLMAPICEGSVTFFFLLLFEWSFLFICYCSLSFLLLGSYGSSWLLLSWLLMAPHLWRERCMSSSF